MRGVAHRAGGSDDRIPPAGTRVARVGPPLGDSDSRDGPLTVLRGPKNTERRAALLRDDERREDPREEQQREARSLRRNREDRRSPAGDRWRGGTRWDAPGIDGRSHEAVRRHPHVAAEGFRWLRNDSLGVLRGGHGVRQVRPGGLLGGRCGRRSSMGVGVQRPPPAGGGVGGRSRHVGGIALRPARYGPTGRRRLHLQRPLEVLLGYRSLRLGGLGSVPRGRGGQHGGSAHDVAHHVAPRWTTRLSTTRGR